MTAGDERTGPRPGSRPDHNTSPHRTGTVRQDDTLAGVQGDLLDELDDEQDDGPLTIAARFERFHEANPHVYRILVRLAREWVAKTGRRRIGIAALWERMRWELAVDTTESPKLNNDYRATFARLIMASEPDLAGLFETRRSATDGVTGGTP